MTSPPSILRCRICVSCQKVDRGFVVKMLENDDDLAIVAGVIGMCVAFRREVVAEGVESERHIEALVKLGCQSGQGYGIARPMPAQDVPAWFGRSEPN